MHKTESYRPDLYSNVYFVWENIVLSNMFEV